MRMTKFSGEPKLGDVAFVKPSFAKLEASQRFQFEWYRYFVTDLIDHSSRENKFNGLTGMNNIWGK